MRQSEISLEGEIIRNAQSLFIILGLLVLTLFASVSAFVPLRPDPDFSVSINSGPAPLSVSFTDGSLNTPTGWAWYFGDETYTEAWTQVPTNPVWSPRSGHSAVTMPDGSIVITGGGNFSGRLAEVWRSTDSGATWMEMNASPGWSPRNFHSSVVMPDGSIVLMGGSDISQYNDVWRSTDNGASWRIMNTSPGWSSRSSHSSVVMPDGSIVLMGGFDTNSHNDVWRSTDSGATWTRMNESAGWSPRSGHSSMVMPDGSIVLLGGLGAISYNDVWRSTDNGATWALVNPGAAWSVRYSHSSVAMPDGSIVLMGGYDGSYKNDLWRSTDVGATWTRVNESAGWSARDSHSCVMIPDGSIILLGGYYGLFKNDVWRLQPAGSGAQNPSHTYVQQGTYQVALQAYNVGGYRSVQKPAYITVMTVTDKIGVFRNSHDWLVDYNNNGVWDGNVTDRQFALGMAGDKPVVGDWSGNGISKMGTIRLNPTDNKYYWSVDYNGNGLWDGVPGGDQKWLLGQPGDIAIAGDWNHGGKTGMGTVRLVNTTPGVPGQKYVWSVDYNGNGVWDGIAGGDQKWTLGQFGDTPVVGDWNGDGYTEMGTVRLNPADNKYYWSVDYNRNGRWDGTAGGDQKWVLGKPGDTPVAGDWNGNGYTEMGTFRLNSTDNRYYWSLDYNGNGLWDGKVTDRQYIFGITGDVPVIGRW